MAQALPARVRVLDEDPDLADGLSPGELEDAARAAVARAFALPPGPWALPREWPDQDASLGLLVLDGLVLRTLEVEDRCSTELLAAGDLLRPWEHDAGEVPFRCRVEWRVLEPTRLALLDRRFAAATAPWPQLTAAIVGRAVRRSRAQGVFSAISHVNRVDRRLILAFWYFAERRGRVRPDGVAVRLPLTHEQLGSVIGARRPSVTTALSSLAERGTLVPTGRGEWLLPRAARGGESQPPRLAA